MHYHIALATFAIIDGKEFLLRAAPDKTALDVKKAWLCAEDYIYALTSLYNAENDANIEPSIVHRYTPNAENGEVVVEYRVEFPDNRSDRVKVIACNGELTEEPDPSLPVVIILGDDIPSFPGDEVIH